MRAFIERIDIYPEKPDNDCWIRNIVFNFPMPVKGKEIKTLPLESQSTVDTVFCWVGKIPEDVKYAYLDYEPRKSAPIKEGATYSEIKDWILDQYGLKVSTFYVAQVKDKCGIKEYENYNHGKEGYRVPVCPPEKEEAIRSAFKHFNMI